MYNGELNAERLDNWVRQIEVYCRIQRIKDDETNIQLASLRFEGATLIWWEAKNQEDTLKKHGKVLSSWNDFFVAIRRQFYPIRIELFHIRFISKHTKIDTLFDSGSQENLISEGTIKKLNLETYPHRKPYPLGWKCDNAKLNVTKRCKLRFSITANFIDEV